MSIDSRKQNAKATKKQRITCEAAAIFALGGGITTEDLEITGS